MARREETGEVIAMRGFPWRLLLYAVVMTAAAGGGGYLTWKYRGEALTAAEATLQANKEAFKLA